MLSNQIILSGITPADLIELFRPMIQAELHQIKDNKEERLISPAEVCKLFNPSISKPTLKAWTAKGLLQDHRLGGRVFYKQSEILNSLQTLKKYKAA